VTDFLEFDLKRIDRLRNNAGDQLVRGRQERLALEDRDPDAREFIDREFPAGEEWRRKSMEGRTLAADD
jgi:hypothetical protein